MKTIYLSIEESISLVNDWKNETVTPTMVELDNILALLINFKIIENNQYKEIRSHYKEKNNFSKHIEFLDTALLECEIQTRKILDQIRMPE